MTTPPLKEGACHGILLLLLVITQNNFIYVKYTRGVHISEGTMHRRCGELNECCRNVKDGRVESSSIVPAKGKLTHTGWTRTQVLCYMTRAASKGGHDSHACWARTQGLCYMTRAAGKEVLTHTRAC